MLCNKCGSFIPQGMGYCPKCGASYHQGSSPIKNTNAGSEHFCKRCGAKIPAGINVCPSCGAYENDMPQAQRLQPQPTPQPVQQQPQQVNIYHAPPTEKTAASIGQYIGWTILAAIPLIGWIFVIVFAIDGSDKNRANFFRAKIILALAIVLIVVIVVLCMGSSALYFLENIL